MRSFSSSNHRVDTLVSYRYVEPNNVLHVLGLTLPGLAISLQSTSHLTCIRWHLLAYHYLCKFLFLPCSSSPTGACSNGSDGPYSARASTQQHQTRDFCHSQRCRSITQSVRRQHQFEPAKYVTWRAWSLFSYTFSSLGKARRTWRSLQSVAPIQRPGPRFNICPKRSYHIQQYTRAFRPDKATTMTRLSTLALRCQRWDVGVNLKRRPCRMDPTSLS